MTEETTKVGVKYPHITIRLIGGDGNAFGILGTVQRTMKYAGLSDKWSEFEAEATSGDYNHLLATVQKWFKVE